MSRPKKQHALESGLFTAAAVLACLAAFWLAVRNPALLLAPLPLMLVWGGILALTGGRGQNPDGGSAKLRRLSLLAAGAVSIIGMSLTLRGLPVAGTSVYVASALLATYASSGVWSVRVPVPRELGNRLLPRALLGLAATVGLLLVAGWIEHLSSVAFALPVIVIAWAGLLLQAFRTERKIRRSTHTQERDSATIRTSTEDSAAG